MRFFIFTLLALCFSLAGCTKSSPACKVLDSFESSAIQKLSEKAACAHPEVIKADIDAQFAKINICSKPLIGNVICPPAVDGIMTIALKVPKPEYGCTGGEWGESMKSEILALCQKYVP
jgi:hypothetical protein